MSSHRPISPSIIPSHSASAVNSTGTLIQQQNPPINQPVDLNSPTSQAIHEGEAESEATRMVQLPSQSSQHGTVPRILTRRKRHSQKRPSMADIYSPTSQAIHEEEAESDTTQMVQLPPQSSQRGTVPPILTRRKRHSQKRPMDTYFMGSMADIWRQNGMGSTPPGSLILPRFSHTSFSVSHSLSIASLPRVVEFPLTPVFKDEISGGIVQMAKVNSARLFESDHLHKSTTTPAPLISSLPAQTQPENASNNTNAVSKIGAGPFSLLFIKLADIPNLFAGPIRHFFKTSYVEIIQLITLMVLWAIAARIHPLGFLELFYPLVLILG